MALFTTSNASSTIIYPIPTMARQHPRQVRLLLSLVWSTYDMEDLILRRLPVPALLVHPDRFRRMVRLISSLSLAR